MVAAKIYDRNGTFLREAKDGEVLSGDEVLRVPIMLTDAADLMAQRTQTILDSASRQPALHRPGFIGMTDAQRAERERTLQARDAALEAAWRTAPPLATPSAPVKTNDAAADARRNYIHRLENAWRTPA